VAGALFAPLLKLGPPRIERKGGCPRTFKMPRMLLERLAFASPQIDAKIAARHQAPPGCT
jgi:hypothetical protein